MCTEEGDLCPDFAGERYSNDRTISPHMERKIATVLEHTKGQKGPVSRPVWNRFCIDKHATFRGKCLGLAYARSLELVGDDVAG